MMPVTITMGMTMLTMPRINDDDVVDHDDAETDSHLDDDDDDDADDTA